MKNGMKLKMCRERVFSAQYAPRANFYVLLCVIFYVSFFFVHSNQYSCRTQAAKKKHNLKIKMWGKKMLSVQATGVCCLYRHLHTKTKKNPNT